MAHKKHELGEGFSSMMRDEIVGQPEPVLRDLPEPKEEPEVTQNMTMRQRVIPEKPWTNRIVTLGEGGVVALDDGVPQEFIVTFTGRDKQPAAQGFTIVASKGNGKPEIRVIGASNVTVG